jgi:hypothetical protein
MGLRSGGKWISGLAALLLLAMLAVYSVLVTTVATSEAWAWGHQLVATFFSVAFTAAAAIWLYEWQSERASNARKTELRNAQYIGVFTIWDQLKDANLQDADLPDGSVERVLLTFLQPTIFEESIRSGLFGAHDTAHLSKLVGSIRAYNESVVRFLPVARSFTSFDRENLSNLGEAAGALAAGQLIHTPQDLARVEVARNMIYEIQDARETVVEVSKRLLSMWSIEELRVASDAASRGQEANPDIAQLVAEIQEESFKISPGGYKGALYAKLEEAKEAATTDRNSACASLEELVEEARVLSNKKITPEEAERFISEVHAARKDLGCQ